MRTAIVIAALAIAASAPAQGEEFGRIEANLNGDARTWYTIVLQQGGQRDATATFDTRRVGFATVWNLRVQGHPRPSFTSNDVLSINLGSTGDVQPGTFTAEAEVMYMPTGMRPPFWTSGEGAGSASVSFETLTVDGEIGRAAGSFRSTICIKETLMADADPTRCQDIEGWFDTQLLIEE